MKRTILLLALFACVPSAEQVDPKGAVAVIAEPSAGTRGEEFTTSDGYRVHLERVVILGHVFAEIPRNNGAGIEGDVFFWNAQERTELLLRAVPAKHAIVHTAVIPAGRGPISPDGEVGYAIDFAQNLGMPSEIVARFQVQERPAVLVKGSATKDGRIVPFDVVLAGSSKRPIEEDGGAKHEVDVRADAAVEVRVEIVIENLFVTFEEINEESLETLSSRTAAIFVAR